MAKNRLIRVLGVMNGTSLDGIDYALCDFKLVQGKPKFAVLKAYVTKKFPRALREQLLDLAHGQGSVRKLAHAHFELGSLYARHIKELKSKRKWRFDLVGVHGQTVDHDPPKSTLQLGSMPIVAEAAQRPVVSDFRSKDVSLGGQGAPLAPLFHHFLLRSTLGRASAAFINLGGIANITWIPATSSGKVLAWDSGPANILMDGWLHKQKGLSFDAGGKISSRGLFSQPLLQKMLRHPYFKSHPPKSTGRELFNQDFLKPFESELAALSLEDQLATLCELTAYTIFNDLQRFTPAEASKIFVAGGGALNQDLMKRLRRYLPRVEITTSEVLGWPVETIEAGAFAYLALLRHLEIPVPVKSITGGKDVVLGSISL